MEKNRVLNHPAYLMPREPRLVLQNNNRLDFQMALYENFCALLHFC